MTVAINMSPSKLTRIVSALEGEPGQDAPSSKESFTELYWNNAASPSDEPQATPGIQSVDIPDDIVSTSVAVNTVASYDVAPFIPPRPSLGQEIPVQQQVSLKASAQAEGSLIPETAQNQNLVGLTVSDDMHPSAQNLDINLPLGDSAEIPTARVAPADIPNESAAPLEISDASTPLGVTEPTLADVRPLQADIIIPQDAPAIMPMAISYADDITPTAPAHISQALQAATPPEVSEVLSHKANLATPETSAPEAASSDDVDTPSQSPVAANTKFSGIDKPDSAPKPYPSAEPQTKTSPSAAPAVSTDTTSVPSKVQANASPQIAPIAAAQPDLNTANRTESMLTSLTSGAEVNENSRQGALPPTAPPQAPTAELVPQNSSPESPVKAEQNTRAPAPILAAPQAPAADIANTVQTHVKAPRSIPAVITGNQDIPTQNGVNGAQDKAPTPTTLTPDVVTKLDTDTAQKIAATIDQPRTPSVPQIDNSAHQIARNFSASPVEPLAPITFDSNAPLFSAITSQTEPLGKAVVVQTTQALPVNSAANPQAVQAVADNLVRAFMSQSSVSVRLDPPEMGNVQINFQFDAERGVTAVVRSELADTSAFLKERAEVLLQTLKDSGFESVTLSFEQGTHSEQDQNFAKENYNETIFSVEDAPAIDTLQPLAPGNRSSRLSGNAPVDMKL